MPVIKTPEERFKNLPDYPFAPHFQAVAGLSVHYVDEGKGDPILLLHGEPTWSFLYRKMIGPLALSHRVIAPDFIGFGKSDKLTDFNDYTFRMHADTLTGLIAATKLSDITLVVHDWGGMIGLSVAAASPHLIKRLVILNTGLPTGKKPAEAFLRWRQFVEDTADLPIDLVIRMGLAHPERVSEQVFGGVYGALPRWVL